MVAYQAFELQNKRDGQQVLIPGVHRQWREAIASLRQAGYRILICQNTTNGIPHSILIGFEIRNYNKLWNVKERFYALTEPLGLPFVSGEFYDGSFKDGQS